MQVNQQDRVLMNSWNELCYLLWTGKLNNILEQKHFKQCTEIKMLYLANAKQFGFVRKQFNLFWYQRMKQSAIIMTPYWYSTCLFDLYITYGFFKNHFQNEIIKSWMLGSGKIIPKKKIKKSPVFKSDYLSIIVCDAIE